MTARTSSLAVALAFGTALAAAPPPALARTYVLGAGDHDTRIVGPRLMNGQRPGLVAGDWNGDGTTDIAVTGADAQARSRVLLVFGRASWPRDLDLVSTAPDVTITASLGAGITLVASGDLEGDGDDDLVLSSEGRRLVMMGRASWPASIDLSLAAADVTILGVLAVGDASVADLDGDGKDDLFLRVPPASGTAIDWAVLRGRTTWPASWDLAAMAPDLRLLGVPEPYLAPSVGDVNGDGVRDLGFGSGDEIDSGGVLFGVSPWPATRVVGARAMDRDCGLPRCTTWVALGDATGDGRADFVHSNQLGYGSAILRGGSLASLRDPPLLVSGGEREDQLRTLAIRDVNGDGTGDLLFAAMGDGARNRIRDAGEVGVLLGPITDAIAIGAAHLVVHGAGVSDYLDSIIPGDFDGDGTIDLLVAARNETPHSGYLRSGAGLYLLLSPDFSPDPQPELFVDAASGDDANDGSSWATAKRSIPAVLDALDLRGGKAVVRVAEGSYACNASVGANIDLVGGWVAGTSRRNPDAHPTILDGGGLGSVVTIPATIEASAPRLDGFTIRGGRAEQGGGIHAQGSFVLANSTVTGNVAVAKRSLTRLTCLNPSGANEYWNTCFGYYSGMGAGIFVEGLDTKATLFNDLVARNELEVPPDAASCGPPLPGYCPVLEDDPLFATGGGVFGHWYVDVAVRNSTIADNDGPGIYGNSYFFCNVLIMTIVDLDHSIVAGNTGADLEGWAAWGSALGGPPHGNVVGTTSLSLDGSNLREDPRFVDGWRLSQIAAGGSAESPAVDAASVDASSAVSPVTGDSLGMLSTRRDREPDTGRLDIGRHWYPNAAPSFKGALEATGSGCGIVVRWDAARDPDGVASHRIYRAEGAATMNYATPFAVLDGTRRELADPSTVYGTTYRYVVRAVDGLGLEDENVHELAATPADTDVPLASVSASATLTCRVEVRPFASDACSGVGRVELHRSLDYGFTPDASTLVAVDPDPLHDDFVPSNGLWTYALVASDVAGHVVESARQVLRVDKCTGAVPPPGEAFFARVAKRGDAISFEITPADGADWHRLHSGSLASLRGGAPDHGARVGADLIRDSLDDVGACEVAGLSRERPLAEIPGDAYFLVSGWNASGEGILGFASFGRPQPSGASLGAEDCP